MRIDEAQLEQSIINLIKVRDKGLETAEILKETGADSTETKPGLYLQTLQEHGGLQICFTGRKSDHDFNIANF